MLRTRSYLVPTIMLVVAHLLGAAAGAAERNVYYILDASGSMWGRMGDSTKIEVARRILLDRIPSLEGGDVHVGIAAYGHNRKGDCGDIEEIVALGPADEEAIATALDGLVPRGKTPMAGAVSFATERLRAREEASQVILISDGEETCHADPCEAVRELKSLDIDFTLDVIGFDLTPEQHGQLQCMASEGGGRYVAAESAADLEIAIGDLQEAPSVPKRAQNIQIVLDRSRAMQGDFEDRTKLEIAREKITEIVTAPGAESENLALRLVGGSCGESSNTELRVPFDTRNGKAIASELEAVDIQGDPTLGSGLLEAAEDFDDASRFADVSNRVVVFAGSRSYCDPREMREVYDTFRSKEIKPDFYFIAMRLPPNELDDLRDLVGAAGGRLLEVENEAELDEALERIFEIEPVLAGIRTVTELLNGVVTHLNEAFRGINGENYELVANASAEGRSLIAETSVSFRDLGNRQARDLFKELYELASENRELQRDAFEMVDNLVTAMRDDRDVDRINQLVADVNDNVNRYNKNIRQIDTLIGAL